MRCDICDLEATFAVMWDGLDHRRILIRVCRTHTDELRRRYRRRSVVTIRLAPPMKEKT